MRGQPGFFDVDDRLQRLSDLGDQLEAFCRVIDFEIFRPICSGRSIIRMAPRVAVRRSIRC